jgi:hypothetical protein
LVYFEDLEKFRNQTPMELEFKTSEGLGRDSVFVEKFKPRRIFNNQ